MIACQGSLSSKPVTLLDGVSGVLRPVRARRHARMLPPPLQPVPAAAPDALTPPRPAAARRAG
jgi:hypothetical protein